MSCNYYYFVWLNFTKKIHKNSTIIHHKIKLIKSCSPTKKRFIQFYYNFYFYYILSPLFYDFSHLLNFFIFHHYFYYKLCYFFKWYVQCTSFSSMGTRRRIKKRNRKIETIWQSKEYSLNYKKKNWKIKLKNVLT